MRISRGCIANLRTIVLMSSNTLPSSSPSSPQISGLGEVITPRQYNRPDTPSSMNTEERAGWYANQTLELIHEMMGGPSPPTITLTPEEFDVGPSVSERADSPPSTMSFTVEDSGRIEPSPQEPLPTETFNSIIANLDQEVAQLQALPPSAFQLARLSINTAPDDESVINPSTQLGIRSAGPPVG